VTRAPAEYNRRYRARHPERARESSRRWRAANLEGERERQRNAHRANPEKYRELTRQWREANPDKAREGGRRYREAHRQRHRELSRLWREANPGRARIAQLWRNHGLRLEGWYAMWTAQDGLCYLCGDPLPDDPAKVHIDHDHRCCPRNRSCRSCRRGLVHGPCNQLVGLAADDPARLRRIAANLAKAKRRIGRLPKLLTLFDLEEL